MNIFLLSWDIRECAKWHCDKHVVKMILEMVQMLYTAWHLNSEELPNDMPYCKSTMKRGYKKIHNHNHPMAKWVRESRWNYLFTVKLCSALCLEYMYRYDNIHSCTIHLLWLSDNMPEFTYKKKTTFPQCMPDIYKDDDPVTAYRNYYNGDKVRFAKWSKRDIPIWFNIFDNIND